jgi:hypothetical protein
MTSHASWFHHFDPEIKMTEHGIASRLISKKFSAGRIIGTVFWDEEWWIPVGLLP